MEEEIRPEDYIEWRWTFAIWPKACFNEKSLLCDQIFMNMVSKRFDAIYTEPDFLKVRKELCELGFTLREIEKWPYVEPIHIPMIIEEVIGEPTRYDLCEINGQDSDWEHSRRMHHESWHDSQF